MKRASSRKATLRDQVAALRRDRSRYLGRIGGLTAKLVAVERKLRDAIWERDEANSLAFSERQKRQCGEEINADAYDRCEREVTTEERRLFEASPAYQRYLRWRAAREERQPFSDAERARRLLASGNWSAP